MLNKIGKIFKKWKRPNNASPDTPELHENTGTESSVDLPADLSSSSTSSSATKSFSKKIFSPLSSLAQASNRAAPKTKSLKKSAIDWNLLIEQLLSSSRWEHHHRALSLLILVSGVWTFGKMMGLALKPKPTLAPPKQAREIVLETFEPDQLQLLKTMDPFRSADAQNKKILADVKCDKADQPTNLPLTLVNTIVLQDSVKSIASVQLRSSKGPKEFREGDEIQGMAKISHINRLEVILKNLQTNTCEYLANKDFKSRSRIGIMTKDEAAKFRQSKKIKGIENVGNRFMIEKQLLDEKLKNINAVLTEARAVQIKNPDGTLAFKMTEVEPGGIFSYLGILNEDIITSINGKPIQDLNEIMSLFGRISSLDKLQLGVKREGEERQMDYTIKK
jgi:type II secretory pathway component PulC